MREILNQVASGVLSPEEAVRQLQLYAVTELEGIAHLDTARHLRRTVPEIIRGRNKSLDECLDLVMALLDASGRAIISEASEEHLRRLSSHRPKATMSLDSQARILVAKGPGFLPPVPSGTVGILTAGTSDIPVARQAQIILEEAGCTTHTFWDVGVAGLHRLFPVVREVIKRECDVLIVAAGQEGALAPVLAGLVEIPIIGLPTSTGTGYGGQGISALMTMLQGCSMGIATVNIDNGIAAAAVAASIARRVTRNSAG